MATNTRERRTVYYSGHVQGVGFRYTAASVAGQYEVAGYVKNLPDGRVELVAEGPPEELERFLAHLRERMHQYIGDEKCDVSAPTGEFADFRTRH